MDENKSISSSSSSTEDNSDDDDERYRRFVIISIMGLSLKYEGKNSSAFFFFSRAIYNKFRISSEILPL
jgi:hypothetical protein